jgi:hypothetical protein
VRYRTLDGDVLGGCGRSEIAQLVEGVHAEKYHDSGQGCIEVNSYEQVEHEVLQCVATGDEVRLSRGRAPFPKDWEGPARAEPSGAHVRPAREDRQPGAASNCRCFGRMTAC